MIRPSADVQPAHTKSQGSDWLLGIIALSVVARFAIQAAKAVIAGDTFCDYANLYLYSRLGRQGIDVYNLTGQALAEAKATMPIHVCGPAAYSPALFYFARLFHSPDYFHSLHIWLVFCLTLTVISVPLAVWAFDSGWNRQALSTAVIVLFLCPALLEAFSLGQTSMLVHFLLVLYFYFLVRDRPFPSAIVASAIALTKINFAPLLAIPFALRRWRLAWLGVVCAAGSALIVVLLSGVDTIRSFIRSAEAFASPAAFTPLIPSLPRTIRGLMEPLAMPQLADAISLAIVIVVVAATALVLWRSPGVDFPVVFSLIVTTLLVISPLLEIHYFLFLFIPIFTVIRRANDHLPPSQRTIFAAAFVVLASPFSAANFPSFHSGPLILIGDSKLLAVFGLWFLLLRQVRNVKSRPELVRITDAEEISDAY